MTSNNIPHLRATLNSNRSQRRNFQKLYRETKLPFKPRIDFENKDAIDEFLAGIDGAIATRRYMPSPARGIIVEERGRGIPRFIPLFELVDSCVYHHCVMTLERESTFISRAANTFAGWSQSNKLRREEEEEIGSLEEIHALPMLWTPYPEPQIELYRFRRLWRDFAHAAYLHSRSKRDGVALMLDISSFFYSVNLSLLGQKIRHSVDPTFAPTIDLLLAFLAFSDRGRLGYFPSTHGIPVEELGDSSRVLAQVYLSQYDERILEHCESMGEDYGYIRFADDQILFAPDRVSAERLLFKASEFLYQIGLQVNTAKVRIFEDMDDFDYYWAFSLIQDSQSRLEFDYEAMIASYLQRFCSTDKREWRDDRIRHLIIEHASPTSVSNEMLHRFVNHCLDPSRLLRLDHRRMAKLFRLTEADDRKEMLMRLNICSDHCLFNGFHLNLLKFARLDEVAASGFTPSHSAIQAQESAYTMQL